MALNAGCTGSAKPNAIRPDSSRGSEGIYLDVTERRRAEEALPVRRDEERNRELRLLLETATQGIVSVDARG